MIRRAIYLLLIGLSLVSCRTHQTELLQEIVISSTLEEFPMTKASRVDTIQNFIASKMPSQMALDLKSIKTGTIYKVNTMQSIIVPIGKYSVTGKSWSNNGIELFGSSVVVSNEPSLNVKSNIIVTLGKSQYNVVPMLNCIGLVIDKRETEKVELTADRVNKAPLQFEYDGNYGVIFVNGEIGMDITLTIHPKNLDNGEIRTIKINQSYTSTSTQVFRGKYYFLHPYEVEKENIGFNMNIPLMEEVDLK